MRMAWLVMAAWLALPGAGGDRDAILGRWLNQEGLAVIQITRAADAYEGRIVWLKEATYPPDDPRGMGGRERVDRDNPDPALRSRRLLGLLIMRGFTFDGGRSWSGGRLYDPQSGKEYRGKVTLASPDTLSLRGYVGIPLFGRTATWTRRQQ